MPKDNAKHSDFDKWIRNNNKKGIEKAVKIVRDGDIALYLGSGVSLGSGIPTWKSLVSRLYFKSIDSTWKENWKAYPNYLAALGDWLIGHSSESPEVLSEKIANRFGIAELRSRLLESLYASWTRQDGRIEVPSNHDLLVKNPTLSAVLELLSAGHGSDNLVNAVVNYNYDDLIERLTREWPNYFDAAYGQPEPSAKLFRLCFHVHGYLPPEEIPSSNKNKIVFSESEYHDAANDPYSWSNLCQIRQMTGRSGIMIGLSLADRNMRRLLRAVSTVSKEYDMIAILAEDRLPDPPENEWETIHKKAIDKMNEGMGGAGKKEERRISQMKKIYSKLSDYDIQSRVEVLKSLGVTPIIVPIERIPDLIRHIITKAMEGDSVVIPGNVHHKTFLHSRSTTS